MDYHENNEGFDKEKFKQTLNIFVNKTIDKTADIVSKIVPFLLKINKKLQPSARKINSTKYFKSMDNAVATYYLNNDGGEDEIRELSFINKLFYNKKNIPEDILENAYLLEKIYGRAWFEKQIVDKKKTAEEQRKKNDKKKTIKSKTNANKTVEKKPEQDIKVYKTVQVLGFAPKIRFTLIALIGVPAYVLFELIKISLGRADYFTSLTFLILIGILGFWLYDHYRKARSNYQTLDDILNYLFKQDLSNQASFRTMRKLIDQLIVLKNNQGLVVDLNSGVELVEHDTLGLVLNFQLENNLENLAEDRIARYSTDSRLSNNYIVPQFTRSQNYLFTSQKLSLALDVLILDSLNLDNYSLNYPEIMRDLDEYDAFIDVKEAKEEAFYKSKGYPPKAVQILKYLKREETKEKLGMFPHDEFGQSTTFNDRFLKLKMKLNGITKRDLKNKAVEIGASRDVGITPRIEKTEKDNETELLFVFTKKIDTFKMTIEQIKQDVEKGVLNLGQTTFGSYYVKFFQGSEAFNLLLGANPGSGKTYALIYILMAFSYLKDVENDKYMVSNLVLSTTKPADFTEVGFDRQGAVLITNPIDYYKFLLILKGINNERIAKFKAEGTGDIFKYNQKMMRTGRPEEYLGKILFVNDEHQQMIKRADKITIDIGQKQPKKLSDLILSEFEILIREARSQGIYTISVVQQFSAAELGKFGTLLTDRILGPSKDTTWQVYSPEVKDYLGSLTKVGKGTFFKTGEVFEALDGFPTENLGQFEKIHFNWYDENEFYKNYDREWDNADIEQIMNGIVVDVVDDGEGQTVDLNAIRQANNVDNQEEVEDETPIIDADFSESTETFDMTDADLINNINL